MKSYIPFLGSLLIWASCGYTPALAQKKLDSIVHYTYSSNGKDSLAIGKTIFDYNSNKQLVAKRTLTTSNFVHWNNELRSEFIYDSKGRISRTNKDSFVSATSTWKTFKYSERTYENDSQYTIQFYEYDGSSYTEELKRKRIALFADGSRKSKTDLGFDEQLKVWVVKKRDSLVRNPVSGLVTKKYSHKDFYGAQIDHYSGPEDDFFRLDSTEFETATYKKYNGAPANTVVYRTRQRSGVPNPFFRSTDSVIYFVNSDGLPDSSHKYTVSFGNPQYTKLTKKEYFTWKNQTMTSWSEAYVNGTQFYSLSKTDFNSGEKGTLFDTIPYIRGGSGLEKYTKTSTKLHKDGSLKYVAQYRWSTIVDSFSIDEKEHYFYSDVFTSLQAREGTASLEVWPNPSTGIVRLRTASHQTIEVLNLQGQVLNTVNSTTTRKLHIANKGAYLIRNRETGQVAKLIIQ